MSVNARAWATISWPIAREDIMRVLRILLSMAVVVDLTGVGSAQEKKATNNEKIIGTWKMESETSKILAVEFVQDGKFTMTFKVFDGVVAAYGTYEIDGENLKLKLTEGGDTHTGRIKVLTETDLVLEEKEENKITTAQLKRVKSSVATNAQQKLPLKETVLKGKWVITSATEGGVDFMDRVGNKIVIAGDTWTAVGAKANPLKFRLDHTKKPGHIDLIEPNAKESLKGIYSIEGDTLRVCYHRGKQSPSVRPTKFVSAEGTEINLIILRRDKN